MNSVKNTNNSQNYYINALSSINKKKRDATSKSSSANELDKKRRRLLPSATENPASTVEIVNEIQFPLVTPVKKEVDSSAYVNTNQPVLQLNREAFKNVAKKLRGAYNERRDDCAHLAQFFIDYLLTGKIPCQSKNRKEAASEHFCADIITEVIQVDIKIEPDSSKASKKVTMITQSTIRRGTLFGKYAPLAEIPQQINGKIDLTVPPIYDIENYPQKNIRFDKINDALKDEAKENGGISFGMVNMGRCGKYAIQLPGHTIVYYATSDEVVFIDCQGQEENIVFDNIELEFQFAKKKTRVHQDTFGTIVFYTPCYTISSALKSTIRVAEEITSESETKCNNI